MMSTVRRYAIPLLLVVLVLFLVSETRIVQAQEKTLVWERFDVDILVNQDSTFDVVERQRIRFISGTFTFGYREIPKRYLVSIDNWTLQDDDGNVYQPSASRGVPYTFTVEESYSSYTVRWYFPPTANTTQTYHLGYRVHGGLRFYEGGDQLWWKAIYPERSFDVLEGRVTVTAPGPIQEYAAYIAGEDARGSVTATLLDEDTIVFDLDRRLRPGEDLEVRVQWPHGIVQGSPAPWQAAADAEAARLEAERQFMERWRPVATLGFGLLGVLFVLGGPLLLYVLWYNLGRDVPVEVVAEYLPEPPDDLPPGLVGALLDETVDMEDILATIVDLARRKIISITEVKEEALLGLVQNTDFIYRWEQPDAQVAPFEKELLKALFGRRTEVRLSDLKNKFYNKLPKIRKAMYEELTRRGLFVRNPETVRNQWGCLGVVALGMAFLVGFVLTALFGYLTSAAILPGIGMGVTAVGLLILSRFMPRKTQAGAEAAARWQAFKRYLQNIDKYGDLEAKKDIWDQYLPYAIAFGIEKEYIRKFEGIDAPAPGWYIPDPSMYGPYRRWYYEGAGPGPVADGGRTGRMSEVGEGSRGGLGGGLSEASRGLGTSLSGMSRGLGAMLTSASAAMTSRPASSSGGGGWGGGGFSGGGSFGGGGGGGGGGGFG